MLHIRYSRWNAGNGNSLDPDSVFDQLNENMNDTGDLQQAMRRLMQKGIKNGEKQTKGIEDLLAQVAREMRKLYDEYRLQSAMEEMQENLDSVVEQEQETLQQMDESGRDTQEKKQFLNDLPGKTSEATRPFLICSSKSRLGRRKIAAVRAFPMPTSTLATCVSSSRFSTSG